MIQWTTPSAAVRTWHGQQTQTRICGADAASSIDSASVSATTCDDNTSRRPARVCRGRRIGRRRTMNRGSTVGMQSRAAAAAPAAQQQRRPTARPGGQTVPRRRILHLTGRVFGRGVGGAARGRPHDAADTGGGAQDRGLVGGPQHADEGLLDRGMDPGSRPPGRSPIRYQSAFSWNTSKRKDCMHIS